LARIVNVPPLCGVAVLLVLGADELLPQPARAKATAATAAPDHNSGWRRVRRSRRAGVLRTNFI
jgi:hypothetical protein